MNLIDSYLASVRLDEDTSGISSKPHDKTTFHDVPSVVHHKIRITGHHKEIAKNLKDGQSYNVPHHLVTTYSHDKDTGTSHFAKSTREGNVVHLHDRETGKHIDTISHKHLD